MTQPTDTARLADLCRFYRLLDRLAGAVGIHTLAEVDGRTGWPERGVYFFFEPSEVRRESGDGLRVVRVGTHALRSGSGTSVWGRLSQHRGVGSHGGGNHRGSIFRLLVGAALSEADPDLALQSWGKGGTAPREVRATEQALEERVSAVIRAMPFLCLPVPDPPGPESLRGIIERNAIALLSNYGRQPLDPCTENWLGLRCPRERVRRSGLWNNNHVDEHHDSGFLDVLEGLIERAGA